jgi:hypothetical protein
MSLRPRPAPADHLAIAWAETISALAEVHRSRRAVDETSRWPLAHACSHARLAGEKPSAVRPFCCRALA